MMSNKVPTVSFKVDGDGSSDGTSGGGSGGGGGSTTNSSPSSQTTTMTNNNNNDNKSNTSRKKKSPSTTTSSSSSSSSSKIATAAVTTTTMMMQTMTTITTTMKWKQTTILLWCTRLRRFLQNYLTFASTPARQEAILKMTQYSLWLLSRYYTSKANNNRRRSSAPPPEQTLVVSTTTTTSSNNGINIASSLLSSSSTMTNNNNNYYFYYTQLAEALLKLSGEILWTRYLLRWFGLPAALEGAITGSWVSDSKLLGKVMAYTMIGYYPLENLAYTVWKAPTFPLQYIVPQRLLRTMISPNNKKEQDRTMTTTYTYDPSKFASRASAWSCRFWLAFIVLDAVRSMMVLHKLQDEEAKEQEEDAESSKGIGSQNDDDENNDGDDDDETTSAAAARQKQRKKLVVDGLVRTERLQLVRNFLYSIQAVQWSLPNWDTQPWLPPDIVNGICWLESIVGMYQTVRNFQDSS